MNLKRIEFENKLSLVKTNSKYVLNNDNINEIKLVTNNLIDEFNITNFNFNDVFKYLVISLKNFKNNYDINISFSSYKTFKFYKAIDSKNNPELFYIFLDGKYVQYNKNTNNYDDTLILIDISSISTLNDKPYYCKYYIYNDDYKSNIYELILSPLSKLNEKNYNFSISTIGENNIHQLKNLIEYPEIANNFSSVIYQCDDEVKINTFIIKNQEIIDVTEKTTYLNKSNNSQININDNIIKINNINNFIKNEIIEINCISVYKEETYFSKILINLSNDYKLSLKLNSNEILSNNYTLFDLEFVKNNKIIKYSENSDIFEINYDHNLLEINGLKIKNICDKTTLTNITVSVNEIKKSFPIFLKKFNTIYISAELQKNVFTNYEDNINFSVIKNINGIDYNIIDEADLEIIILNDSENIISFNKKLATFKINNFLSHKEILILFKYYDKSIKKYFYDFKTIYLQNKLIFKDLIIDIPNTINSNESLNYKIYGRFYNNELNNDELIILNNYSNLNISSKCLSFSNDIIKLDETNINCRCKSEDFYDTIKIKFNLNKEIYEYEKLIEIKYIHPTAIKIFGDTNLQSGIPSNPYIIKLYYNNGNEEDITFNNNLKLSLLNLDKGFLNNNILIPKIVHNNFNIILNAKFYINDCKNEYLENNLNIFVNSYNLINLELSGKFNVNCNSNYSYSTIAYYSNGWIKNNINSTYTFSNLNGELIDINLSNSLIKTSLINENDETILNVNINKSLFDKRVLISSRYDEPGYENEESIVINKEILINGGFKDFISGTLLIYNEDDDKIDQINFKSNEILFPNLTNHVFNEDFIIDYIPTNNILFKNIKNLNTTQQTYQLIDIIDENENLIKISYNTGNIISNNKLIDKKLIKGKKYKIKFYNLIDSFEIENCRYKSALINNLNNLYCSTINIKLDQSFNDSYIIGISNLYINERISILHPILTFKTSKNYEYLSEFILNKENNIWITKGIPLKANKLKNILLAFAFQDYEI